MSSFGVKEDLSLLVVGVADGEPSRFAGRRQSEVGLSGSTNGVPHTSLHACCVLLPGVIEDDSGNVIFGSKLDF